MLGNSIISLRVLQFSIIFPSAESYYGQIMKYVSAVAAAIVFCIGYFYLSTKDTVEFQQQQLVVPL